ncbi:hypothetical protein Nepgr_007029 [Nepenthes gracilis]|uniref:Uncharacterized protein n=1 Tax=Nepenthes gracilis TaxID=150966 RepID=A0AAD3XHY6_NEPGR|nr:hypothetical protein Nepgr_007029 [Nepenthes gracilis]
MRDVIISILLFMIICGFGFEGVSSKPQVPCYFIFGDSLSDNGNNNGLISTAKVNYSPYGVDFPAGIPTGRFSNGRTAVDIIAQKLGFKRYIPPFKEAMKSLHKFKGVNYASGGAGILPETGRLLGGRVCLNQQMKNHKIIISKLAFKNGGKAMAVLNKCLYTMNIGNNDYINNYFMPEDYISSHLYTPRQYAALLIRHYSHQLKILYQNGARKVALFGLGLIGCTPAEIAIHGATNGSACVDNINAAVLIFNDKLISLVDKLNARHTDANFTYINNAGMQLTTSQGFKVFNSSCCKVRSDGLCQAASSPCKNRSEYVFWDSFHPTEAVNAITGRRAYLKEESSDAHPMDISHLVKVQ